MTRKLCFGGCVILTSIAVLWTTARSSAQEPDPAIQAAVDQFYEALNAMFTGELAPMQDVWSHQDDVTYMGPDGTYLVGWDAVLADWKKQAARKLGGKIEPQQLRITAGRDLAVIHNYEVGQNVVDGQEQAVRIRTTSVFRKEQGRWKMIGHHTDLLPFLDK